MTLFNNSSEEWQRLDWQILRDGGISLYWRPEYLAEDVNWLAAKGYDIYEFDCERWNSETDMYSDFERVLRFSEWWGSKWGQNLNALDDCLGDLPIRNDGGVALVFHRFNAFETGSGSAPMPNGRTFAADLLDVLAATCRFHLLNGKRFVTLVQTENHNYRVQSLGAVSTSWNRREWLNANREPGSR